MELNELRKIAEQATPGPWVLDGFGEGGCSEGCCEEYTRLSVYSGTNQGEVVASEVTALRNAAYFDSFDPLAVLALLSRLEQAEQDSDKLRNRLDAMRRQRDGYRNQLRRAEQQVARVREVLEYRKANSAVARDGLRALDGDGRG